MRIRIYQNSAATLGRGMHVSRPQSSLFNLCIVSRFLSALWMSLFSLFHLPLYFFYYFLRALACFELYRASSEEMFSHSSSRNCYTSHPSGKTRCRVYYNTLSAGQEWTGTHTEYLRWHWKPPLSSLPLWSTHTGPPHCSFEKFQCGIRLIHLNYHNICRAVSDSASVPKRGGLLFSWPIMSTPFVGRSLWTCGLVLFV